MPKYDSGGGSPTVGGPVLSATNSELLFVDGSGNLAQDAALAIDLTLAGADPGNKPLVVDQKVVLQTLASGAQMFHGFNIYQDGTNYKAKTTGPGSAIFISPSDPIMAFGHAASVAAGSNMTMAWKLWLFGTTARFDVPLNMNSNQINNLADPTSIQDAATKNYVDVRSAVAYIYSTANTTLPNTTWTTVTLDTVGFDSTGSGYTTNANYLTIPVTGYYTISYSLYVASGTGKVQAAIWQNDANLYATTTCGPEVSDSFNNNGTTGTLFFTAGDTVKLRAWQNSGGNLATQGNVGVTQRCYMAITRIR